MPESSRNGNQQPSIAPRIKTKILESVQLNRLSIIVGPTGCGKSTLVPSLLLEGLKGRICCTQPRRLAVVAISKRVADMHNVPLGGDEIGYHVGNQNRSLKSTSLLFTTAGILLEELRANGVEALKRFKCLVIDECHERSPESDLVLALVKKFMKTHPRAPIRLVLMSATFDHKRYKGYFTGVPGCDSIDTITLETAQSFAAWHQQVETFYLDDMKNILTNDEWHRNKSFLRTMRSNPNEDLQTNPTSLSFNLIQLISSLVRGLDETEDKHQPFLIFCPTYRHLEQLYRALDVVNSQATNISVLHSAVDIEDCIRTMYQDSRRPQRHIFLASAIADSSITVPGVAAVIDLCRSLQVRWNASHRQYQPRTVWSSKSICNQRQGRTGRTGPGKVFRLVHQAFFISNLEPWDVPQLQMSSCHNEVLAILCADSHRADPMKFFASCLDAPPTHVVYDSLQYLEETGACQKSPVSDQWEPTAYGRLLASVPLSVREALVFLEGARLGLLHETVALAVIFLNKPSPIVHHFGESDLNESLLKEFFPGVDPTQPTSVALANLSAFLFWDIHWYQVYCANTVQAYEQKANAAGTHSPWQWTAVIEENHSAWCKKNDINPTSVRSITETIESTMNVLFRSCFNFDFLKCTNPTPLWKRPSDWKGLPLESRDLLSRVYGLEETGFLHKALTTLCDSKSALKALVPARNYHGLPCPVVRQRQSRPSRPIACVHFLMGTCKYGSSCRNSHSRHAQRPPCRFFRNGTCSRGAGCVYSHADLEEENGLYALLAKEKLYCGDASPHSLSTSPLVPQMESLSIPQGPLAWFKEDSPRLFLLGEGDYSFSKALMKLGISPRFAADLNRNSVIVRGVSICSNLDATTVHTDPRIVRAVQDEGATCFGWNFPYVEGADENPLVQEDLLLSTLQSFVLLQKRTEQRFTFALTLQADQFSRWNVLRSVWRTNWRLLGWCDFDETAFPGYCPRRANGTKFPCDRPVFYLLQLPLPSVGH